MATTAPKIKLPHQLPPLTKAASVGDPVIWTLTVTQEGDYGVITTRYGREGGKMREERNVIKEGKNLGKANATTAVEQALAEAQSKWQKKLDSKGYSQDATGKESAEKRDLQPMLAETYEDFKPEVIFATPGKKWTQPKWDGHRCVAHITKDGVKLFSRGSKPIPTMPHIVEALQPYRKSSNVRFEELILVDGELFDPDADFEELSGTIRGEAKNQERADLQAKMVYHVYDLYTPSLPQLPLEKRLSELARLTDLFPNEAIKFTPTFVCNSHEDLIKFRDECIADHQEGCMLRLDLPYHPSKRSKGLYKCKVWIEKEFEVIGVSPGKSTFADKAIFMCMMPGDPKKTFTVTAPGDNEDKRRYLKEGKKWIGQMLTVKYFCLTRKGVPKMPQAKAFRLAHE